MAQGLAACPEWMLAATSTDSTLLLARFVVLAALLAAPLVVAWPYDADIAAGRRLP